MREAQDGAKLVARQVALPAAALAAHGGRLLGVPPAQRLDGAAQHDHLGGEAG